MAPLLLRLLFTYLRGATDHRDRDTRAVAAEFGSRLGFRLMSRAKGERYDLGRVRVQERGEAQRNDIIAGRSEYPPGMREEMREISELQGELRRI